jgi:Na+/glutamate symporter
MNSIPALHLGLAIAAVYAVIALAFMVFRISAFGRKPIYSKANGSELDGIKYAFTSGMMPSAKESVRMHLPTFIGGIVNHAGVFVAALHLILAITRVSLPPAMVLGLRLLMLAGLVSGVALLVKRLTLPKMRIISTPDDVIANVLVDLFLAISIATTMSAKLEPWLLGVTIVLLVYIPLGKIRHCAFFFVTRMNFGRLFGRRGVLPHRPQQRQVGSR